jgi:hypothetical protein
VYDLQVKILIVADGNAQHVVLTNWLEDLRKLGHEIKIATLSSDYDHLFLFSYFKKIKLFKLSSEIINIKNIITLKKEINQYSPDFIWFHNVNNEWSWSCLLVQTKNKAPKVITLHELNSIYPGKVTEKMLDSNLKFMYYKFGLLKGSFYKLRSLMIRFFLSKVKVVSIGKLQNSILISNQINVGTRIENYITECNCELDASLVKENTILFAGRQAYKGLDVVVQSVLKSDGWILIIAGGSDLLDFVKHALPSSKYRYLGQLTSSSLHSYIHSVKFVAVLSQCYDNFPTIGLEAIVHGALPVTTNITGISSICEGISSTLVLKTKEVPDLEKLDLEFYGKEIEVKYDTLPLTDSNTFFDKLFSLSN